MADFNDTAIQDTDLDWEPYDYDFDFYYTPGEPQAAQDGDTN